MRPSALTRQQSNNDLLRGFPALMLLMLGIFFLKSTAVDNDFADAVHRDGSVFIQIEGDVKHPGVYSFDHEPGVHEAIEMGEGPALLSGAGNTARDSLSSGAKITVRADKDGYAYSLSEMSSSSRITLGIPVSINRETEEGLTAIPGIGPQLAAEIVKERDKRGGFKSLEELRAVRGIGKKKYKVIENYITLQ
jgi:competence protein ComEA